MAFITAFSLFFQKCYALMCFNCLFFNLISLMSGVTIFSSKVGKEGAQNETHAHEECRRGEVS